VRKAIALGAGPAEAYTMASHHAAQCFGLNHLGAVAPGYQADFLLLDDVETASIHSVYKAGKCVFSPDLEPVLPEAQEAPPALGSVNIGNITKDSFRLNRAKVIGLIPGELITTFEGYADAADTANDIVKVAVIERHRGTGHMGKAYLKGYGLQSGAIATSVAHDAHNIIAAGVSDADMALAVCRIAEIQGGMVIARGGKIMAELPLPIAGLMCALPAAEVHKALSRLTETARALGVSPGIDPFMTLSFVSLPVIPALRLTTRGLVATGKDTAI
jgi:adenine deaminase